MTRGSKTQLRILLFRITFPSSLRVAAHRPTCASRLHLYPFPRDRHPGASNTHDRKQCLQELSPSEGMRTALGIVGGRPTPQGLLDQTAPQDQSTAAQEEKSAASSHWVSKAELPLYENRVVGNAVTTQDKNHPPRLTHEVSQMKTQSSIIIWRLFFIWGFYSPRTLQ